MNQQVACHRRIYRAYLIFDIFSSFLVLFRSPAVSLNCQDISDRIIFRIDIWLLHTNGHFRWRTLHAAAAFRSPVNTPDDNQNELDQKERSASEEKTYFTTLMNKIREKKREGEEREKRK